MPSSALHRSLCKMPHVTAYGILAVQALFFLLGGIRDNFMTGKVIMPDEEYLQSWWYGVPLGTSETHSDRMECTACRRRVLVLEHLCAVIADAYALDVRRRHREPRLGAVVADDVAAAPAVVLAQEEREADVAHAARAHLVVRNPRRRIARLDLVGEPARARRHRVQRREAAAAGHAAVAEGGEG